MEHEEHPKRVWLNLPNGVIKLHPYCSYCGCVKNVSSDRGKKFSYFVEKLSELKKILKKRGYKVSEVQIRLILKELSEIDGFEDIWSITFSKQKELFIQVVRKHIKVSKYLVESIL